MKLEVEADVAVVRKKVGKGEQCDVSLWRDATFFFRVTLYITVWPCFRDAGSENDSSCETTTVKRKFNRIIQLMTTINGNAKTREDTRERERARENPKHDHASAAGLPSGPFAFFPFIFPTSPITLSATFATLLVETTCTAGEPVSIVLITAVPA